MGTSHPLTEEEFWSRVDRRGECWLWTRAINDRRPGYGYGRLAWRGRLVFAHRLAWSLANAQEIPERMCVLHRCDNPPCVRPDHLFIGTHRDNSRDMAAKGRHSVPALAGEQNPSAKLRRSDVLLIRVLRAIGMRQQAIAEQFGVTQSTVSLILSGRTWRGT